MSTSVNIAGTLHTIPATNDENWGAYAASTLNACAHALQRNGTGGDVSNFILTSDINFGTAKGLNAAYYISSTGSDPATNGVIRLNLSDRVCWGSNNFALTISSNALQYEGANVVISGSIIDADISASAEIDRGKIDAGTADHVVINDDAGNLSSEATLSITRGGTGASTAITGFDALAPLSTKGDILTYHTSASQRLGVGSNGQVLTAASGQTPGLEWADPEEGGINYIPLADRSAETSIGNWETFNDGGTLVDGSGPNASPTGDFVTLSRNTVNTIRGTGSLKLAKNNADASEMGISTNLTAFDRADMGHVQEVSFDYDVTSNYVANDLVAYIYDIDNAQLIQPTPYQIPKVQPGLHGKFKTHFQTPNGALNYRLILNIADTTAQPWEARFDNIKCGPQVSSYGPAVTDWRTWTPTGSWTTNSTYTGKWRRVGDQMECQVQIALGGAPDNTNLTINTPTGYSIDTTKILSSVTSLQCGGGSLFEGSVNVYKAAVRYADSTTVSVLAITDDVGVSSGHLGDTTLSQTVPFTWGTSDFVYITFSVPIAGWSSNVEMSSDTDTRVVAARYTRNTTQTFTDGVEERVDYDDKDFDTHGAVTTGSAWVFTCPVEGIYRVSAVSTWTSRTWANTENGYLQFKKNTVVVGRHGRFEMTGAFDQSIQMEGSQLINCNAGDTISVNAIADITSGTLTTTADEDENMIQIERLSGPSQIAASEFVGARYTTDTADSIAQDTSTRIYYDTKVYDTHGAVTATDFATGDWIFTAPVAGKYTSKSYKYSLLLVLG